jgi:iron complex outermembrane receptor protein
MRVLLLSGCAVLAPFSGPAFAQQTAEPAETSQQLPALEVTAKAKAKKAKAKTEAAAQAAPQTAATVSPNAEPSDGQGAGDGKGTKPGLNLDNPSSTGSRLGLTPLQTPASVEVIPGETIRERGQQSVNDAVTQNATGFTSVASPGNGGTAFAVRGFAGHNSVMRLYDGTRLYLGNGTVTFPFDTWSAERIEGLAGL